MRSKATPPEVCGFGTQIASDGGSIANSRNDPTFNDPPAHSNHPTEPFLKGMHTLAQVCGSGTQIASDGGSIANSRNDPTFNDLPVHFNHPAEPFVKGIHTLAQVCGSGTQITSDGGSIANSRNDPTKRPHVQRPSRALQPPGRTIPEGNAYPSPGLPSEAPATPGPRSPRALHS
jgi:hypothetical protein